jgi:hypothetical protein
MFTWFKKGFFIIPSLVQIAVIEVIGTGCIGAGVVARLLDQFGAHGRPPVAPIGLGLIGWFGVGAFFCG